MLDALQTETFCASPTFRKQILGSLVVVGIKRWKMCTASIVQIDAMHNAGLATPEHLIARQIAQTERTFLENSLAVQGINLGGYTAPQAMPGMPNPADEGITRMINMVLEMKSWTWTVADWLENQPRATEEIAARMYEMLESLAAQPSASS